MPPRLHRLTRASAILLSLLVPASVRGADRAVIAGATTGGGLVEGTEILHVSTLSDAGPGSLREAITHSGPKVIVFDVAGVVRLTSDLKVHEPFITIAGQTAPAPGITLAGGSLRIRTHDVVIQHIAVRPGPSNDRNANANRDGISVDGDARAGEKHHSYQVRIENVSVSWSIDEALSLWFPTTRQVTISNSIISEALVNAGHPKGSHSMGLLVGTKVQGAQITGNLFASNAFRNPAIGKGASAFVANNFIVNPGTNAIHFYATKADATTLATVSNNVVEAGPSSQKKIIGILYPWIREANVSADKLYIEGNTFTLGSAGRQTVLDNRLIPAATPPVAAAAWRLLPANQVRERVLRFAGTRPGDRNPVDRRLMKQVRDRSLRLVDRPPEALAEGIVRGVSQVPQMPFALVDGTGRTRLDLWLCDQHFAVGGMETPQCPR